MKECFWGVLFNFQRKTKGKRIDSKTKIEISSNLKFGIVHEFNYVLRTLLLPFAVTDNDDDEEKEEDGSVQIHSTRTHTLKDLLLQSLYFLKHFVLCSFIR